MKKFALLGIILSCLTGNTIAQTPYTSTVDDRKVTILNGIISKYALENNPAFASWYGPNQTAFKPDMAMLNAMEAAKGKVQFVVFGGTWCEDTQVILPKFFKAQQMSGFADNNISFFAVDRSKKTLGNLTDAFKITNVPTIIIMKDGKETGRLVEYGKSGKWETEFTEMLTK
ncbi:MAG: thioredoxin family protein [Ferruginibacter sp.]